MKKTFPTIRSLSTVLTAALVLSACGGDGDSSFGFLDATPTGDSTCAITTYSPTQTTLKVAAAASTETIFTAGLSDTSCTVTFKVNGTTVTSTHGSIVVLSSQLNTGSNTITATSGSTTQTWTVTKNSPPTCSQQTPAATGNAMAPGGSLVMTAWGADADGDTLSFDWQINNASPLTGTLSLFNGIGSSQATFTPTSAYLGTNTVSAMISDGYDTSSCSWTVGVAGSCSIASESPAAPGTVRVPGLGTTSNTFQVTTDDGCAISWALNGTALSGTTAVENVLSSQMLTGANVLQVAVTNGSATDSKTWTVIRNTPPTCASQTPAPTGSTVGVGSSLTLTADGNDSNGLPLTFSWLDNGAVASTGYFAVTSPTGGVGQAVFTPDSTLIGTNAIVADISDGYDTASCTWNVNTIATCSITTSTPSASSIRTPYLGTSSTSFVVVPNNTSCAVSWSLNGTSVGTGSVYALLSSALNNGPSTNTLTATASNGFSSATKSWTVLKNSPPTCAQSPTASGNTVGVGNSITLTATGSDANSDPLSFSWSSNGSTVNSTYFTVSNSTSSSQVTFSPNSSYDGTNTIMASINDGYDTTTCSWNVSVLDACAVSSSVPAGSTAKVAHASSTSTSFGVVPSSSACGVTWALNGTTAGTGSFYSVLSSTLNDGPTANTVTATLNNGYTTPVTRSWSVVKNSPPVCASQTPVANPTAQNYTTTRSFSATGSDVDGDAVSFTWEFDGASSSTLFTPVTTSGYTSSATFVPTLTQVGTGQTISAVMSDGLDTGSCSWVETVEDPNTVSITSCTPSGNPIVLLSTGSQSTNTLTAVATGDGLTYQWLKNGTVQSGYTTPTFAISSAALGTGNYTFETNVTDAYNNAAQCNWNVKVNAPPVIGTVSPSATQSWKMNLGSTLAFSVSATDANNDSLTYTWTLDSVANSALPSGAASSTFNPAGNTSLLGTHTVMVTVSDGYESASQSWTVTVNLFSQACNTLYNAPTSSAGGEICTLVGIPQMGNGYVPTADQTQVKARPAYIIDDGSGNLIYTDQLSHAVVFYNLSGSSITRWGKTMAAGTITVIMGNGANGITQDALYNTAFKLDTPMGLAYDPVSNYLYVADYNNHRIARMDNTGYVLTIFGIAGTTTNGTATNTDGAAGTTHVCANPTGLDLVTYGGSTWLYVSCYGTNAIKKMNADTTSGNYGKGYTVIGRLSSSGATAAGSSDGTIGPSGDTMANGPWALADDGGGNIYWTEIPGSGGRVRMATTGSTSGMTFFGAAGYQQSQQFTITATDLSTTALTAGTGSIQAVSNAGGVTQLAIYGPTEEQTSSCVPYRVVSQNTNGVNHYEATASSAIPLTLSGTGANGAFYTDSGCTSAVSSPSIAIGASEYEFYYKKTTTGATSLSAASTGLTSVALAVTVSTAGTAAQLAVYTDATYTYSYCSRIMVQQQTSSGVTSTSTTSRTIRMSTNATGNFYSDANCATTPINEITMASGTSDASVYFARTTIAPAANTSVSLFGNEQNNNTVIPATVGTNSPVGLVNVYSPRGLTVYTSGGNVEGFFISNYGYERIFYVNNSSSTMTFGGDATPSGTAQIVLGTGTAGFNTDGLGETTRIYTPYGLSFNPALTRLYFGDMDNYRVRYLDVSTNSGYVTTLIGAGYARAGNLGDSPIAATSMYLNGPSEVTIDNTASKLYVSDSASGRIRRVDLTTGYVDTIVGQGVGGATVEDQEPTLVMMQSPRTLLLMNQGSNEVMLYADQSGGTGVNSNCMIRAYNMSGPDLTSFFGNTVPAGRVSTLVGNYAGGCEPWNTAPANTNGMAGLNAQLYYPEGLATDGTNLYVADTNDHCIVKVSSAGTISQLVGTCGTAGTTDGSTQSALIRYPMGITIDPNYAANGNFYFADAPDINPSRVRYVNFRTTSVTIGSTTVPAATSPYGIVQTLWTVSPSGNSQGRVNSIATFGTQVCYAAGYVSSGNTGAHNVTCYDISSPLGPVTLRIGPNEANNPPTRGGAPLDLTEEGVYGGSALTNAPYGLAFDSAGNLYISERTNSLVRMVRRWF